MKIVVDPIHGLAVPDGRVADTVTMLINNAKKCRTWSLGTLTLVNEFRLRVKRKEIADLVFVYQGKEIQVDKDGRLSDHPEGFCDIFDHQLDELLG